MRPFVLMFSLLMPASAALAAAPPHALPSPPEVDAQMQRLMRATQAQGLALAVIDDGKVAQVHVAGKRNAAGEPLQPDTIMYAASLTKAAFAYMLLQLVDDGIVDLDRPIAAYLDRPLPDYPADKRYAPWPDLVGNTLVCVERGQRCVVILGNDVRAEAAFPALVRFVLSDTGAPWTWEYGNKPFVR